ncbi:hypothetical protein CO653_34170 [Rhizobium anhuiense]|nr:hypothetical protein CO653_34170 [Rhizobium anhuiense]
MTEKRERRRNCADRLRAELMTRKIHRGRRLDPAMSVAIQMLAIVSALVNLFPAPAAAAEPLPEPPRREPVREPQPAPEPRSYKSAPSWPKIMSDLARPVARSMATAELYARLPVEVRPWLDEVVKAEDWASLRPYARSGATDDTASAGVLAAFRRWKAEKTAEAKEALEAAAEGGKAGSGAKPGGGDDGREVKP